MGITEGRGPIRQANIAAYGEVLASYGVRATERGIWLHVGETPLVQGWKLHISTIPLDAEILLDRVLGFLLAEKVAFKILRTPGLLSALNAGELGDTQIGKFITVYPQTEEPEEIQAIAASLVERSDGLRGPAVPTDCQLGDVVFTRYGGIHPVTVRDRLGETIPSIRAVSGELVPDSYLIPFQLPPGRPFPFDDLHQGFLARHPELAAPQALIGPGYRIAGILNASTKGSVFLALDLREQSNVAMVVLKQGCRHCYSDMLGRDARFRLQRQAQFHHLLQDLDFLPRAGEYFEWRGDGYLPLTYIEGQSIEGYAGELLHNRRWQDLPVADRVTTLDLLLELARCVETLHGRGLVHRDLSANNLWITSDRHIVLLDLELMHAQGDPAEPLPRGTPGFISPNQEVGGPPVFADDIYSLGSCAVLALTGVDPQRVVFGGSDGLSARIGRLTGISDNALLETIALCLHPDADSRPSLSKMCEALEQARQDLLRAGADSPWPPSPVSRRPSLDVIRAGLQGLFTQCAMTSNRDLWLSHEFRQGRARRKFGGELAVMPDANRGIAGVIYLLARAARCVDLPAEADEMLLPAAEWLTSTYEGQSQGALPGLHFGRAGAAVALAEAVASGMLELTPSLQTWLDESLGPTLDWPDVTHGAAGIGIAALSCARLLQRPGYAKHAENCADYLVRQQVSDGSWPMPSGVPALQGEGLTGFAHGAAGIIYFMVELYRRTGRPDYDAAWRRGLNWLLSHKVEENGSGALEWPYSDRKEQRWHWWCHGAPGIALAFLRIFEVTGETRYGDLAGRILAGRGTAVRGGNLTQCHGLSGLAEIYLEAYRVLNQPIFRQSADRLADLLLSLGRRGADGSLTWLAEETAAPTADLMVGAGGVVHLFLDKECRAENFGFPLLLPRA